MNGSKRESQMESRTALYLVDRLEFSMKWQSAGKKELEMETNFFGELVDLTAAAKALGRGWKSDRLMEEWTVYSSAQT